MKRNSIIAICICALAIIAIGCDKTLSDYGDTKKLDNSYSFLKINYESNYANNRSVWFKINDQRVGGPLTARAPFPGGGYNTGGASTADVISVTPGTVKLSVILPYKVDNGLDSLVLYTTTFQMDAGKTYISHITDTTANTKSVLTQENVNLPDTNYARLHFLNLMPNVPAIDVYYGTTATTATDQRSDSLMVSNLGYMQNSADIKFKMGTTNAIWKIRVAGSGRTNNVISSYTSTSVPLSQRVLCGFALGYSGKTSAAQKPYISFLLVR
jgi:hypothetical protein